jgi:hypothetical protein
MSTDFIDFPAGFLLQREIGVTIDAHLDPRCSAVQTDGALLCDCGAIAVQWAIHGGSDWKRYIPEGLMDVARARLAEAGYAGGMDTDETQDTTPADGAADAAQGAADAAQGAADAAESATPDEPVEADED